MTTAGMGGLKILSLELSELLFPITVESMEIEPDSMGQGKQIGGAGVRIALRPIASPMENYLFGDGATNPPHGVLGGTPGIGGGNYKENRSTGKRTYCSTKGHLTIGEDEVWVGISSGGGGYGDPLEREPQVVQAGVRDEIISLEAAQEIYGVVLDPKTLALDLRATLRLRQRIASRRGDLELVTPNCPSASRWLRDHMREGDEFLLDPQ